MWNGAFSPETTKALSSADVVFDPENTDNLDADPEWIVGTLSVRVNSQWYKWGDITYQQYLDFQSAGFSRAWMNEHLPINYVGDWGWPWGRIS